MEVETCAIKTPQGAQLNPPRCFSSSCPSRAATLSPPRTHHVPARPDPGARVPLAMLSWSTRQRTPAKRTGRGTKEKQKSLERAALEGGTPKRVETHELVGVGVGVVTT